MLNKWIGLYCKLLSVVMVVCLATMVLMVFGNVVLRYGFNSGITVSEELSRWLFLWVVFMGATVAVHEKAHMGVDSLVLRLPAPLRKAVLLVGHLLMLFVTWLMFSGSWAQTRINWDVQAPVTGYSMAWAYACGVVFAVSTGVMLLMQFWALWTEQGPQAALPQGLSAAELRQSAQLKQD
jgi:TRAP-type C4-dicarboxylate transport system permease small subunit